MSYPLSSTNIDAFLAGDLSEISDRKMLRELLESVAASMRAQERTVGELKRDVSIITSERRSASSPLGAAIEALSVLSYDEQKHVLDVWARSVIAGVNEEADRNSSLMLAARNITERAKRALIMLSADAGASDQLREYAREELAQLVDVPALNEITWEHEFRESSGFTVPPRIDDYAPEMNEMMPEDAVALAATQPGEGAHLTSLFDDEETPAPSASKDPAQTREDQLAHTAGGQVRQPAGAGEPREELTRQRAKYAPALAETTEAVPEPKPAPEPEAVPAPKHAPEPEAVPAPKHAPEPEAVPAGASGEKHTDSNDTRTRAYRPLPPPPAGAARAAGARDTPVRERTEQGRQMQPLRKNHPAEHDTLPVKDDTPAKNETSHDKTKPEAPKATPSTVKTTDGLVNIDDLF
jgi:hypothetical protein